MVPRRSESRSGIALPAAKPRSGFAVLRFGAGRCEGKRRPWDEVLVIGERRGWDHLDSQDHRRWAFRPFTQTTLLAPVPGRPTSAFRSHEALAPPSATRGPAQPLGSTLTPDSADPRLHPRLTSNADQLTHSTSPHQHLDPAINFGPGGLDFETAMLAHIAVSALHELVIGLSFTRRPGRACCDRHAWYTTRPL
jgi:hypothetical protein